MLQPLSSLADFEAAKAQAELQQKQAEKPQAQAKTEGDRQLAPEAQPSGQAPSLANIQAIDRDVQDQLILLYIVKQLPDLSRHELTQLALESLYMDYFRFELLLNRLQADGLVHVAQRKFEQSLDAAGRALERCALTGAGEKTLSALFQHLPQPVRQHLYRSLESKRAEHRLASEVQSKIRPLLDGRCHLDLSLSEGSEKLIELKLLLPDEAMARDLAQRWQSQHTELYPALLASLFDSAQESDEVPKEVPKQDQLPR